MASGTDDWLHRLWTRPGQTLRGRVNHRAREPPKSTPKTSSQRIAESCVEVNIIVIIMKLWNFLSCIKIVDACIRACWKEFDDHIISGRAVRTAAALEESGFYDRSGALPGF